MECFMCDSVQCANLIICNAKTKYRKIPLTSILYDFIGSDFEIAIGNEERICEMCKMIFDEFDRLRCKLDNIENILTHKLHRKYKFDSRNELPAIRLDEQTANRFAIGQNEQKFQCKNCSFSTDFLDCLTPHNLMHQNQSAVDDLHFIEFPCKNCRVILPTEVLFREHNRLFHSDENGENSFLLVNGRSNVDEISADLEETIECTVSMILDLKKKKKKMYTKMFFLFIRNRNARNHLNLKWNTHRICLQFIILVINAIKGVAMLKH